MKKSLLVLSICALFASDVMADAQVSGSVGVEAGVQNFKKSKKIISNSDTLRFKKLNNFVFGLFADCNYNITPDFYVGLDIGLKFMNKKAKLNIDEASLVAGIMSVDTPISSKVLTETDIKHTSTGIGKIQSDVLGLFSNKKFLSIRYKTMFTLGAHFGYRFNSTVFAELGFAWARLNAKYRTTNVASAADLEKFLDKTKAATAYEKLFDANTSNGILDTDSGKHPELGKKLVAALTDSKVNKNAKIKKNGLQIRGLVGFNVASNCAVHVAVNYVTTIKSWGAALGVSYKF